MEHDHEFNSVKTDVELLKRDVSSMQGLISRLDDAIDRIAGVSNDIGKMLALQQQNLNSIRDEVDERKRLSERETELLHKRINDMKDESAAERKANHAAIMQALSDMRAESKIELNAIIDEQKALNERVRILERWKWWVMGGSWAIGFIIATVLQMGGLIEALSNSSAI